MLISHQVQLRSSKDSHIRYDTYVSYTTVTLTMEIRDAIWAVSITMTQINVQGHLPFAYVHGSSS